MQITGESQGFDPAMHASLFMSFSGSGDRSRGIAIHSTLGKRPAPRAGAYQEKFNFAVGLAPVAHSRNYRSPGGTPVSGLLP
jgi:hypothetical protein